MLESRTVQTSGKLQVKINNSYNTYGAVSQQTDSHYWADGKSLQKVARNTYDSNQNFTSEIIEDFDQSGKQVSGSQAFP